MCEKMKPRVLILDAGGTVSQKPNPEKEGAFEPSDEPYLHLVEGLEDIAEIELKKLYRIDSTNMNTTNRESIAHLIYENALNYSGIVVIMGTDTMAETGAALTYMVQDAGIPIVLTGAQSPIWAYRTDAKNNIFTAVEVATMDIGEVVCVFGNSILRGTRFIKWSEDGYEAFQSPGVQPLGKVRAVGTRIELAEHRVRRSERFQPLQTYL